MAQAHKTSSHCVEDSNIYFAKQVINNACGTQALLNIMMNAKGLELGKELTEFKEFTADFPADLKGEAMSNSDMLRSCHNSFARPEPFEMEQVVKNVSRQYSMSAASKAGTLALATAS